MTGGTEKQRKREVTAVRLAAWATLPMVALFWELIIHVLQVDRRIFPGPVDMLLALAAMAATGDLWRDLLVTTSRLLVGFLIGSAAGCVAGILTGTSPLLHASLGQIFRVLRPISPVALVPATILWFGFEEQGKLFLVAWGTFFTTWVGAHIGVSSADERFTRAAASLGRSRSYIRFCVRPLVSLNVILASLRTALAIATICVLVAEMSAAGVAQGIGFRAAVSYQTFRADRMFAALAMIGLLGFALDRLFVWRCRRLTPWIRWTM